MADASEFAALDSYAMAWDDIGTLPGDYVDTLKMQQFTPQQASQQGLTWWQSLIGYGITKAVDNRTGPSTVTGNVQPGSFAGANGQTYLNGQGSALAPVGGIGGLLLIAATIGALVYMARG